MKGGKSFGKGKDGKDGKGSKDGKNGKDGKSSKDGKNKTSSLGAQAPWRPALKFGMAKWRSSAIAGVKQQWKTTTSNGAKGDGKVQWKAFGKGKGTGKLKLFLGDRAAVRSCFNHLVFLILVS